MIESIDDLANAPPEFLEKMFEKIIFLAFKEQGKAIRNLEDRIEILEKKIDKLGGK